MIRNTEKTYWDEDVLRIQNEVRRHDQEPSEPVEDKSGEKET